jgi:hypothetical protein
LKRSLRSIWVTTIVAAFQMQVAAAVIVSEDVPVAGGTAAFARAAGIDPPPDRARFVAELARVLYSVPDVRRAAPDALVHQVHAEQRTASDDGRTLRPLPAVDLVPVPLTAATWSDAVFHRRVAASELVSSILADRQAALLCHGLAALDDPTLAFFVEHPAVITRVYAHDAEAFGAFAGTLHIRDGRVLTPGGEAATPLWEAAAGENATRPDRFVRELFTRGDGRLAYLYDTIGQLDARHAAFALGLWIPAAPVRAERFRLLVAMNNAAYPEWHVKNVPFARPIHDIASLLMRVAVAADGSPAPPAAHALWSAAFAGAERSDAGSRTPGRAADDPIDAAWLAQAITAGTVQQRGDRLDQFSFGQRAFAAVKDDDRPAMLMALRGFDRYHMLMLTLDRIGVTAPSLYVDAARHASRLAALDGRRGFVALAQFQGVVALVARMVRVRTLDAAAAQRLIGSLTAVPVTAGGYNGGVLRWIDRELRPLLARADDVESGMIVQLAGVQGAPAAAIHVMWEGQSYHLDLAAAEARRLRLVRDRQHGPSLDVALAIEAQARKLSIEPLTADDVASGTAALTRIASVVEARSTGDAQAAPRGVTVSRDPHDVVAAVVEDLARIQKLAPAGRVAHVVEPLTPAADAIAADALLSLAYAVDLGDPDGTALLAGNVARRHDFGFGLSDDEARARVAWDLPKQEVMPGSPWHVRGSALGLDVALASLTLRRVDTGRVTSAPTLTSNERQTFMVSVALMSPSNLTDADRDAIADAIDRGRTRVAQATTVTFDALADEIALDGWRRRAAKWSLTHDAGRAGTMFSLTELLALGGGRALATFDAWGMGALATTGCLCTRMSPPGRWRNLTGRPQLGLLATTIADVNLHVAVLLRDLGLPAAIARHVLTAAVQDYIDEVRPSDSDDWLALARGAQAISRDRVEDDIAAITAGGPLVPDGKGDGSHFFRSASESQTVDGSTFAPIKRGQVTGSERSFWVPEKRLPSPFPGEPR